MFGVRLLLYNLVVAVVQWKCLAGPLGDSARGDVAEVGDKCSLDSFDRCMQSVVVYSINDTLPLDADGIHEACEREIRGLECLHNFLDNNCVHGFAKGLLRASFEGLHNEREAKCDEGSPRNQEYMKYVPCINKVGPKARVCMREGVQKAEAVHRHTQKKHRIPYGCCAFEGYLKCVRDAVGEECSPEHVEYAESIIVAAAGDVLTTACETYKGASVCTELDKLPLQEPEAVAFTSPLIKVLEYAG